MTGFESFVGVNPWTALFTFCNMLITFAVLKKFLFKPVKKMIDDRQQEIDMMYADADAAKQKAADLEKEYADHLQSIKDERDAMLREATARAQKREEEIVGEARAEAASIRAAAEADIAQERKKAVNDLKNEIGKTERSDARIAELNEKVNNLYGQIMGNEGMVAYNEAKRECENLVNYIDAIINTAMNGGDPMTVQEPSASCTGS